MVVVVQSGIHIFTSGATLMDVSESRRREVGGESASAGVFVCATAPPSLDPTGTPSSAICIANVAAFLFFPHLFPSRFSPLIYILISPP